MTNTMLETTPAKPPLSGVIGNLGLVTARDLMRPVDHVIDESATLADVVDRFREGTTRHLVVLDREGRCAGVLGPRHVAQAHQFDARRDDEIPVSQLGCAAWICLAPNDTLRTCAQLLVEHDLDALPVLDEDQRAVGIVTSQDIVRATADAPAPPRPRRQEQDRATRSPVV